MYHSQMDENARINALRYFEYGESRVLVSCKALDEGFNVPETDVGIIVSTTNSDRQRIQRIGRTLRKKCLGESRLYYLYIENSVEEMSLLHELGEGLNVIPIIDVRYSNETGFTHPYYDELAMEIKLRAEHWEEAKIREFERNIELGRVSSDWLHSEEECRERITSAKTRFEKNYYVTMLMLAKEKARLEQDKEEDAVKAETEP